MLPSSWQRFVALQVAFCVAATVGCDNNKPTSRREPLAPATTLERAELLDPETCKTCHRQHYDQWASSMHAYATDDPVFVAMNKRGQRDADLGPFCLECHAPMAVREGYANAVTDPASIPKPLRGVTCYFCHNIVHLGEGDTNNPLELANDTTMRGGIKDPVKSSAHGVQYAAHLDGNQPESADLCGKCHDIETPAGVHLERTHAEWKQSLFSDPAPGRFLTCAGCHMASYSGVAASDPFSTSPTRRVHQHLMPGVDKALSPFPEVDVQDLAVRCALQNSVSVALSVRPRDAGVSVRVAIESNAGHGWPSGATQDRRAWVEVTAYDAQDKLIFEHGRIPEGTAVSEVEDRNGDGKADLFQFRDRVFDANDKPVHMFWEAEKYVSEALPPPPRERLGDHVKTRDFPIPSQVPAKVRATVFIRPIDVDLVDDLVKSGDLDEAIRSKVPTFTVGTFEWLKADGFDKDITTQTRESSIACPSRDRMDAIGPMEAHRELLGR